MNDASNIIPMLVRIIQSRKTNAPAGSYTAALFAQGEDEIAKKVGEEAIEVILAAKAQGHERLVSETADLIYHLLVLLEQKQVAWAEVEMALQKRMK